MSGSHNTKQYMFPVGHVFFSETGQAYRVTGTLGRGGQGEAYHVRGDDGEYAVKYYYPQFATSRFAEEFRKNIARNAENGLPQLSGGDTATQFVWPLKMIKPEQGSFGYLMRLFPPGFEPLSNVFMQSRWDSDKGCRVPVLWKSWFTCVTAALNMVRAFEILYSAGLSYQDLNEGGFAVDVATGNVLICDCDNVAPDGVNLGIRGVMNYMAPEVVCGTTRPNRHTDEYSLAIILFRLFFHGHPMEGAESRRLHNLETMSRNEADESIYGKNPHYCLDPQNGINSPDPKYNYDVCSRRFMFPMVLMNSFEQVFSKGVTDPSSRLTASEWRRVLMEVRDSLILVNGQEQFFGLRKPKPLPPECRTLVYPHGRRVLCMPGKILYRYHMSEYGTDFKNPVAKIIPSQKPGILGLYNATGASIRFSGGGKVGECPDQGKMPLLPGMELEFGNVKIKVE